MPAVAIIAALVMWNEQSSTPGDTLIISNADQRPLSDVNLLGVL